MVLPSGRISKLGARKAAACAAEVRGKRHVRRHLFTEQRCAETESDGVRRNEIAKRAVAVVSQWRILEVVLAFRETSLFTRRVVERLTDSEYLELQAALMLQPELGDLIPNTGGIRKLRWGETLRGKGKRGGVRVIYYWYAAGSLIYLLHIYSKTDQADLSGDEKTMLRKLVSQEFK